MPVWGNAPGVLIVKGDAVKKRTVKSSPTANTTINATADDNIFILDATNANITLTLPHPSLVEGKMFYVRTRAIGTGRSITINVAQGGTIDGSATKTLAANTCYVIFPVTSTNYETLWQFTVT